MVAGSSSEIAALGQSSWPAERAAHGRAKRKQVPRSSQGDLRLPNDRADPVALLERQGATRVPELVPIRYGRMLVSPFNFYRGAALIMAGDLASSTPRTGLGVQCCGDAHLSNFGVFASPAYLGRGPSFERALVQFAHTYAVQNQHDYDALSAAVASGRIVAETGL